MNTSVVCLLTAIFAVIYSVRITRAVDTFTTKYDHVNIKEILTNDRLLKGYIHCILHGEGCNAEGNELREHIPDALANDCAKCTAAQREKAEEVLKFLYENKQEYLKQLEAKYDTTGNYRKRYLEKYGKKLNLKPES